MRYMILISNFSYHTTIFFNFIDIKFFDAKLSWTFWKYDAVVF